MNILGIESTCDETGVSIVKNGRRVLSNVVASSVDLQKKYGGIVPEVAAREQVRSIIPVVKECISTMADRLSINDERSTINEIGAIAVAHGPGLIGSLLIGVETAKTLALAWDKPLIPVNHLVGHIYSNWLLESISNLPKFPVLALIVSGGHTDLVLMGDHGDFKLLGSTLDDAAGEAFDKVARLLGLEYPGGPEIEKLAVKVKSGKSNIKLPRPMMNSKNFDFSFSGLKTAVVNLVDRVKSLELRDEERAAIAYEFQQAIVDVLVKKTIGAAQKFGAKTIVVGGGVGANELLRSQLTAHSSQIGAFVSFPSKNLSLDNGAMIAAAAFYNFKKVDPLKLSAAPGLHF